MEKIALRSYAYLMNESFNRIRDDKKFNSNFEPYTEDFISKMISYFEKEEEYEKCEMLFEFKAKRFNHEENYYISLI